MSEALGSVFYRISAAFVFENGGQGEFEIDSNSAEIEIQAGAHAPSYGAGRKWQGLMLAH